MKRLESRKKIIQDNLKIKQVTNQLMVVEMERQRQRKEKLIMYQEDQYMKQF